MTRESGGPRPLGSILIHTSVKLVTEAELNTMPTITDFNPHEREARDSKRRQIETCYRILIHTSVKLVTFFSDMARSTA